MRIRSLIAGAALVAASLLAPAVAHATPAPPAEPAPVCATWKAEGATGAYPAVVFGAKPEGTVITKSTAKLVKPVEGVQPGVQLLTRAVEAEGQLDVTVAYALSDGASSSAGAVRLFGYAEADADVLLDAPDWVDAATGDEGTLKLTVPAGKTVAVLGLVYDASNDKAGTVTFSGMKLGDRPVSFTPCPEPTQTATPKPTGSSSGSPKPTASSSSSPATPVPGAAGPTLPVTGPGIGAIAGIGLGVLVLGVCAFVATRRRGRQTFEA